jgi:PAS domain S-box-containing protein
MSGGNLRPGLLVDTHVVSHHPDREVVESQSDIFCRFLPDTTLTFVNDPCCQFFRRERADIIGRKLVDILPESMRTEILRPIELLKARAPWPSLEGDDKHTVHEYAVKQPDGSVRWLHWVIHALLDEAGVIVEFQGVGRDVTELRNVIKALSFSNERNHALLRALPDMMFLQTRDGTYLDYHAPDPAALLVPPERFLGRRMDDLMPPELAARFHAAFEETLKTGRPAIVEYQLQLADGERWFEARIVGCNDRQNILAIVRDITARLDAEDALRRAQTALTSATRLSWMGALAASLSHEITQPLTAIAANAAAGIHCLDEEADATPAVREMLTEIVASAHRAGQVIRRTLDLFAREPLGREAVHPTDIVHAALVIAEPALQRARVSVQLDLRTDLPRVVADRSMLLQVLLNLFTNAIDAMQDVTDRVLTVSTSNAANGDVLVAVGDSGPGLNGRSDAVFEPFHTSRAGHIGIGLTISRAIAEAHGGTLRAVPLETPGARFELRLPFKPDPDRR